MKNIYFALLCVVTLFLAGCASRHRANVGHHEGEEGVLIVWHNWPAPESDLITKVIEHFNATHPEVIVVDEYVPSIELDERFIREASSGLGPDLLIGSELFLLHQLIEQGLLDDLSQYNIDTHNLLPEAVDALRLDGALYGVPFAAYTDVMYYNKNLVDEPPILLDDLLDAAKQGKRVALSTNFYHAYWGIHAQGGEVLNEDGTVLAHPGFVSWLEWLDEAQKEPTILLNPVYDDLYTTFAAGEAAYFVGNSFDLPDLQRSLGEEVLGVGILPRGISPAGSVLELETLAVNRNSAEQDLAVELIRFFINNAQQRRIALSNFGQIPLNRHIVFDERFAPVTATLLEQSQYTTVIPLSHVAVEDVLRVKGTNMYTQVLEGILTPEEGVTQLVESINSGEVEEDIQRLLLTEFHQVEFNEAVSEAPDINLLFNAFRRIGSFLRRPAVQVQALIVLAVVVAAYFLSQSFWRLFGRLVFKSVDHFPLRIQPPMLFLLKMIKSVTFPILGLVVLALASQFMAANDMLRGLVIESEFVFGLLVAYGVLVVILFAAFEPKHAKDFRNRYLFPLFLVLVVVNIMNSVIDILLVGEVIMATIFNSPLTIRAIFMTTIGLYLWIGLAQGLQDFFYWLFTHYTRQDPGTVKATLTLLRYVMIGIGIGYAFSQFDLNATTVAAITGGLSVGIGFGLREILSNFISGVLLLFERSLHPGDVIEVDNHLSVVQDFSVRATTVLTQNHEELVIPNQTFFTSSFKTYTGTDTKIRTQVMVQTDCNIDLAHVMQLMHDVAMVHKDVMEDPKPSVFLLEYGNNVTSFQLNIWINQPMRRNDIISEVKVQLWDALSEHNVALPFPEIELLFPKPVPIAPNNE